MLYSAVTAKADVTIFFIVLVFYVQVNLRFKFKQDFFFLLIICLERQKINFVSVSSSQLKIHIVRLSGQKNYFLFVENYNYNYFTQIVVKYKYNYLFLKVETTNYFLKVVITSLLSNFQILLKDTIYYAGQSLYRVCRDTI